MAGEEGIDIEVNGTLFRIEAPAQRNLLDVLRDDLKLTGSKRGCDAGDCGACTVLLDGEAVNACLATLGYCEGRRVTSIEGLSDGPQLHRVQQAFLAKGALLCGFCTPGMIMATVALLGGNKPFGRDDIKAYLNGNVCRCGCYEVIVDAVEALLAHAE